MTLIMVYFHEAPTLELELLVYIARDSMINHSCRKTHKRRMHIISRDNKGIYYYCCLFSCIQNDVFDSNSNPSLTSSKLAARPVVRRSASDSIGARLRKISFEIGNGRRNSDDLSPDELKNIPQVCFKIYYSFNYPVFSQKTVTLL